MFHEFNSRDWTIRFQDEHGTSQAGKVQVRCTLAKADAINRKLVQGAVAVFGPAGASWQHAVGRNTPGA